jgi:hypothetical protein
MKLSGDMTVKLVLGAAAALAGYYVFTKVAGGVAQLGQLVPQTVKDGAAAGGQLLHLGGRILTNPLDTFGVVPPENKSWIPTVPWAENEPPVDDTILDARDAMARQGGYRAPDAGYYKKYADPLVTDDGMDFRYF